MSTNITTQAEIDEAVKSAGSGAVIVDFWAAWCGPCRMVAPILDEIENEGKAKVLKVDVDANPELAAAHGVQSIPMLRLFKNGGELPTSPVIGVRPKNNIEGMLSAR